MGNDDDDDDEDDENSDDDYSKQCLQRGRAISEANFAFFVLP